ncbi:MAG: tRNA (adenosine(37)-N6)-dimethylallyltransferase MiaA [Rhodospirillaceae bacterium]
MPKVVVVAGPTASGKSRLAMDIATRFDGVIINADSQQRYGQLKILSAFPSAADMNAAPHQLFGDLAPEETGSAAEWASKAAQEIRDASAGSRLPIVVGGTGFYLRALMEGMADIPPVPNDVRRAGEQLLAKIGNAKFHERLVARDPATVARLAPGDTQRLLRAWEVVEATGVPLSDWHTVPSAPPIFARYFKVVILPPREDLYAACNARFQDMVAAGAVNELRAFLNGGGSSSMPIMRILGARELRAHLAGEIGLGDAIASAQTATRQYAKRQVTWFKHQFSGDKLLETVPRDAACAAVCSDVEGFLST